VFVRKPAAQPPPVPAPTPYRQESLPAWIEAVATLDLKRDTGETQVRRGPGLILAALRESSTLPVEPVPPNAQTLHLVGSCPACEHEMDKVIRRRLPDDPDRSARNGTDTLDVLVYCNCSTVHPNRPADRTGCGSYGWLRVTTSAAEPNVTKTWTAIPEDLRWELEAEQLYAGRLDDMRATAQKWTAAITSLTGVFSIVALIKGPETIAKVLEPWRGIVYGFVIAAVLLALVAIALAAAAAGGTPRVARLSGREADTWTGWQAAAGKHELLYSRRGAIAAVLAMLTAIALTWFAPSS